MKVKVVLALTVFSLVAAAIPVSQGADVIKLNYANYFPPTHPAGILAGQFCEEVTKRTNGRIELAYHPGGTLSSAPKMANSISQGIVDLGLGCTTYNRGRFPVTEVLDLPHGFPSAWVSGQVQNDFFRKFKPKEWDEFHVLYFHSVGPFLLNTLKKPVKRLEELKGMKIRGQAGVADTISALGGTPIPLDQADVYESLRRGVIDGVFGPFEVLKGWKFGELLRYTTASWKVGSCATFYVVMNRQRYDSLPADLKKTLDEVSAEYKDKFLLMWNQADIDGQEFFKQQGGTVVPISDDEAARWVAAVQAQLANYKSGMVKRGFSEKEIDGYFGFVKDRIAHWSKVEKEKKIPSVF